jgi:succinoglycan biosynthesis protein ExoM
MPTVTVCVITYRRPEGLADLLEGIERQLLPQPEPTVEVVVVDNDPHGSSRFICDDRVARFRWPLRYAVEPEPGISQARNRALQLALPAAERVAFIDDDEVPAPTWLAALLAALDQSGADVATGPVLPDFPEPVPEWVVRGNFFQRPHYRDGTEMSVAATNNALIHRRVFERLETWFDPNFGLTGSGDTLFFMRVKRAGFRIVWAAGAVVVERVPPSRATTKWLVRRSFRGGNGYVRCTLLLDRSVKARLIRTVKGVGQVLEGLLPLPLGMFRGQHVWMKHCLRACFGLGSLAGVFGYFYHEYRRTAR